jgi:MFS family permease
MAATTNAPGITARGTGETILVQHEYPSARAGWWATTVFFLLYTISFIDRQMLNLLVEPIKATLKVSDFEVSLLQGMTFALFYTVFGVAIGWLVDHGPRRRLIFAGVVLWSIAASGCGLAARYWQMALARVGVAVGEATLAPAAYSLMSDIFPPRRLALPMSFMGSGAPVGTALAMIIGSYVMATVPSGGMELPVFGTLEGWQVAFFVAGVPGLLLAPLVFTIAEPARIKPTSQQEPGAAKAASALPYLAAHRRFYFGHFMGFALYSMINYGLSSWLPTFLIRRHGMELSQAGYASGLFMFAFSTTGAIAMGFLVDRWYARGRKDAHLLFFAGCTLVQLLSVALAVSVADPWVALVLLIPQIAASGFTGVAAAALQIGTPARMRGQVSAIYLLVFNLIGLGLGPTSVAFFTDFVFRDEARVGSSILLTYAIFAPLAVLCMLSATRSMRERAENV